MTAIRKECSFTWTDENGNLHTCFSKEVYPYISKHDLDQNIYWWCKKHGASWGERFRQLTLEEMIVLEVIES